MSKANNNKVHIHYSNMCTWQAALVSSSLLITTNKVSVTQIYDGTVGCTLMPLSLLHGLFPNFLHHCCTTWNTGCCKWGYDRLVHYKLTYHLSRTRNMWVILFVYCLRAITLIMSNFHKCKQT